MADTPVVAPAPVVQPVAAATDVPAVVTHAVVVTPPASTPVVAPVDANKVDPVPQVDSSVKLTKYRLSHDGDTAEIEACDEIAARAMFNDGRRKWPAPRNVTVEIV